jgi:nicotinamidase-related amidase
MTEPQTLRSMAGAPADPARLGDAVVIIIDAQNEYVSGALPLPGVEEALAEIDALLTKARSAGAPVIHVKHIGAAGSAFDPDDPRGDFAEGAKPLPGEAIVEKRLPNAFADTNLGVRLTASGKKKLIVAGFQTHMCISSTVRAATDAGYDSTVIASACATRDLPSSDGSSAVSAKDIHEISLASLADRFAVIAPYTDVILL